MKLLSLTSGIALSATALLLLNTVPAKAAVAKVSVVNFAFVPATTNINVNDTVIWTWVAPSANHNIVTTASPTPAGWTNEPTLLSAPASFTNTFIAAGDFPYKCSLHSFTGSIVVSAVNEPPTNSIISPANGAVFSAPAKVTIQASAGDPDGSITNVQFKVGATLLTNETAAPFLATANNLPAGTYTFTAIASDNLGATATNFVSINVVTPITITLAGASKFSGINFQFSYAANTGLTYAVEHSSNLIDWISIVTNTAASNPVVFTDLNATNSPNFYRVQLMPNP
ncbi:MAG TPA: Ig-like domain-containing protein [Verrucomicrobiae bacterium]|nr:Ig-like domain-containing protein [Verrucomicrobiae bacterium]